MRAAKILEADGGTQAEALVHLADLLHNATERVSIDALALHSEEDEWGDLLWVVTAYRGEQVHV